MSSVSTTNEAKYLPEASLMTVTDDGPDGRPTWFMAEYGEIRTGRHCAFLLHAHLVFVTKYRHQVFTGRHLRRMKEIMRDVCTDFEVELKDSGLVLTVPPDQTLLTALRAANVDVQSDCEEGLCGSCEVRVLAGKVDHRDVVLTRMERDANTKMMACCSRACEGRLVLEL